MFQTFERPKLSNLWKRVFSCLNGFLYLFVEVWKRETWKKTPTYRLLIAMPFLEFLRNQKAFLQKGACMRHCIILWARCESDHNHNSCFYPRLGCGQLSTEYELTYLGKINTIFSRISNFEFSLAFEEPLNGRPWC